MKKKTWKAIAKAWEPYVGASAAEERARNAALILLSYPAENRSDDLIRSVLTNALIQVRLPQYGGVDVSASTIVEAVNEAVGALRAISANRVP